MTIEKQGQSEQGAKKAYTAPRLTVYGPLEKITKQLPPKVFGPGDGAVWQGQAVQWSS